MDMEDLDRIDELVALEHIKLLLDAVGADENGLIIDRGRKPLAALIPAELYDELASDRDNRIWQSLKRRDPDHVRPVTRILEAIGARSPG